MTDPAKGRDVTDAAKDAVDAVKDLGVFFERAPDDASKIGNEALEGIFGACGKLSKVSAALGAIGPLFEIIALFTSTDDEKRVLDAIQAISDQITALEANLESRIEQLQLATDTALTNGKLNSICSFAGSLCPDLLNPKYRYETGLDHTLREHLANLALLTQFPEFDGSKFPWGNGAYKQVKQGLLLTESILYSGHAESCGDPRLTHHVAEAALRAAFTLSVAHRAVVAQLEGDQAAAIADAEKRIEDIAENIRRAVTCCREDWQGSLYAKLDLICRTEGVLDPDGGVTGVVDKLSDAFFDMWPDVDLAVYGFEFDWNSHPIHTGAGWDKGDSLNFWDGRPLKDGNLIRLAIFWSTPEAPARGASASVQIPIGPYCHYEDEVYSCGPGDAGTLMHSAILCDGSATEGWLAALTKVSKARAVVATSAPYSRSHLRWNKRDGDPVLNRIQVLSLPCVAGYGSRGAIGMLWD